MLFAQPYFGVFILVVAGLILFFVWAFRMRQKARSRFAEEGLLPELLAQVDKDKQALKAVLVVAGICFCLLALMRPQWGFRWQEVKRQGLDIMIALDTSRSMLAEDIKPSRLERAKLAIGDFVRNLQGDRVGLVVFAGSAFLECPLTVDYGGFFLALENIDTNAIPKGGTSISAAIKEALRGYPQAEGKNKVLIIITDGEDHEGDPLSLAQEAKKAGVVICCIGIGTREGELIFATKDDGTKEFLKDAQGNAVKSRLDEELLQKIALAAGGAYVRSTNTDFGLEALYRSRLSGMEKREFEGKMNKLYTERFQIPLGIGLLLLLLELMVSDRKN